MSQIIDGTITDVQDNCYIVDTGHCKYQLPPNIGTHIPIENGQIIAIDENIYLRLHIPESTLEPENNVEEETEQTLFDILPRRDENCLESCLQNTTDNALIWKSARNPTDQDINATITFLQLRTSEKFDRLFNDKKTVKSKIWQMIAEEMKIKGFDIGSGKEAAERCRQKFYNLQKTYIALTKESKQTGASRPNLPKYYDLMHKLFGNRHNIQPCFTLDSSSSSTSASGIGTASASCSNINKDSLQLPSNRPKNVVNILVEKKNECEEQIQTIRDENALLEQLPTIRDASLKSLPGPSKTRFETVTPKPKSNADKIIGTIRELHREQAKVTEKHFSKIEALLQEQNQYKREFLEFFKSMNREKRKRSPTPE